MSRVEYFCRKNWVNCGEVREIKHSINNALAVMMAHGDVQRRPDYSEKLATTVLTKAPQIVSSLQEFTQALNEKAGPKPQTAARETK